MTKRSENILIIGGGIGGLSAAIALHQKGFNTEVVEISEAHQVYHVGIIVQTNFLAAMGQMGIADDAIRHGFPYSQLHHCDQAGQVMYSQPIIAIGSSDYPANLGLTRPALHQVLKDAIKRSGIPVHTGVTFSKLDAHKNGVHVSFTDGRSADYDLVIGADGIRSKVRDHLFGEACQPAFTGQGVWRYNVPRPPELTDMLMYRGKPGMTVGLVPLDQETMYVFSVCAEPGNPFYPQETLVQGLRDRLESYGGYIPDVREQVTRDDLVVYRPLESLLISDPWYRDRIILIGDAAHPSTPHIGQGAAMAVEDAVVLADQLDREPTIAAALNGFMQRRFKRVEAVVDTSLKLSQNEMNPDPSFDVKAVMGHISATLSQPI